MEVNMVEEVAENTSGFNIGDVLLAPAMGIWKNHLPVKLKRFMITHY